MKIFDRDTQELEIEFDAHIAGSMGAVSELDGYPVRDFKQEKHTLVSLRLVGSLTCARSEIGHLELYGYRPYCDNSLGMKGRADPQVT